MRIVFVVDPLAQLKAYKDSTVAMIEQAQQRVHHRLERFADVVCHVDAGGDAASRFKV